MNVPLLDLQAQYLSLRDDLRQALDRVMSSQRFVLGDEGRGLENSIVEYCQTAYAVGCASGSDALLLALMALDVKAGDEVITTPFSFFATAASIAVQNSLVNRLTLCKQRSYHASLFRGRGI